MKNKSMLLGVAVGLSFLGVAQAQNTVYITGSTALRSHIFNVLSLNSGGTFTAVPTVTAYQGSSESGSTYMMFTGTAAAPLGGALSIKCHWSGSEGGIGDLNGTPATETFLNDVGSGGIVAGDQHLLTPSGANLVTSAVGLALADNSVVFSKAPNAPISGSQLGVITFKWVREKNSAGTFANIRDTWIRASLQSGGIRLSQITGNEADSTWVYITGRNNNSGTRVNTFGSTGFGIFKSPKQLQVGSNGAMLNGGLGDFGYDSGGSVATQMGYDLSLVTSVDIVPGHGSGHFSVAAYLGTSDAAAAVTAGGTEISYNDVAFSQGAVEGGQYTFWGNEFIYELVADAGTLDANDFVFGGISSGITSELTDDSFIQFSAMHVTRSGPTTDPVHK